MTLMKKERLFVSIDIPEGIKKEILKIQNKLPEFQGKKTTPENLHLTLKFLGEIDEKNTIELKKRLGKIKFNGFETKISEIGVFSPQHVRIIWLKLNNCEKLQKNIDYGLKGLFKEEVRFMSHLTIARVKNVNNRKIFLDELKKIELPKNVSFLVDLFYLKKSKLRPDGPIHTILEEYPLE